MTRSLLRRVRRDLWERPRSNSPGLDGLRGFAIAIVVLYHCAIFTGLAMDYAVEHGRLGWARPLLVNLWTGVDIFFVLSGFLIGSRLIRDARHDGSVHYGAFLVRRIARIFPAYYLVLGIALFGIAGFALDRFDKLFGTDDWSVLAATSWTNFLFVSNYALPMGSPNLLSWGWSVCVEEHFYLLLPPLVWLVFRRSQPALHVSVLVLGIALPLVARLVASGAASPAEGAYFFSHLRFDELFVGVLIGYVHTANPRGLRRFAERAGPLLWIAGWACIGGVWVWGGLHGDTAFQSAWQFSLVALGAGLLLVNCLHVDNWVTRLFSHRAWYPLARISYGLYLVHPFAVVFFLNVLAEWIGLHEMGVGSLVWLYGVTMGSSCLFAAVMFVGVERPALDLGARLFHRRRTRVDEALPPPRDPSRDGPLAQPSPRVQWILLAALVLAVALLRLRLLDIPLERDEGDYAYGARMLLQGLLPYRDFYTMRMPGIYAAYALPLAFGGHGPAPIHLALLLANAVTTVLVFLTGRSLLGPIAGLAAAAFFGALGLGGFTLGLFANSEHYVVLLALGGIATLACAGDRSTPWRMALAGLLLGSAVAVKHHGVLFVGFGAILAATAGTGGAARAPRAVATRLAAYAAGAATPFALVCVAAALLGLWRPFWFWTVEYAGVYASSVPAEQGLARLLAFAPRITGAAPLIWVLAAGGFAALLRAPARRRGGWQVVLFALCAAGAVALGLYFRAHYFIMLFPAVALLAGAATQGLARAAAGGPRAPAAALLVAVAAVGWVLVVERGPLFRETPVEVTAQRYGANPFPESLEVGRYLAAQAAPGDRLLVLGSEPQIYFYAGRNAVTPHMHMYPLMEGHAFADEMQQQLIRDAEAGRPEFIVVTHVPSSWLSHPDSSRRIYDWMYDYIPRHYVRVGLVEIDRENGSRYYWDADARGREPTTDLLLQVFRRVPPGAHQAP